MTGAMHIRRATEADVVALAPLFDRYRQFYGQPSDVGAAADFLAARFAREESVVFVAEAPGSRLCGFTQLYPALCSVAMRRYWILYDLFVDPDARGNGVGRLLMDRGCEHAIATGAQRVDLETALDNVVAQSLYESLGFVRERHFAKYSLSLPSAS